MIMVLMALMVQDWTQLPMSQVEDVRLLERVKAVEERIEEAKAIWPALEVIRKELAESRKERDRVGGQLATMLEEIRGTFGEFREIKSGLLSTMGEVRAEVFRARAELAEAQRRLAEAQSQLAEVKGSLGSRFFWFTVYLVGGLAVLLIGGSLILGFVYLRLVRLINTLPLMKVV